ncbi:MAG: GIDE domain-containing protein [Candidatus Omnitrophica bacterium]|nr:GIDE domain-containing protein [Candidatus Omnitrophota bacterium]
MFFQGFTKFRRHRLIANTPTSTVRGMAMGLVELMGKVRKPDSLISPIAKTQCALYKYTVERYESHGKSSSWVNVAGGNSYSEPFFLDDGTSVVPVYPQGAEIVFISPHYQFENGVFTSLNADLLKFLEEKSIKTRTLFGWYKFRFREWCLFENQDVYVLGNAQKVPAALERWNWGERNPSFFQEWDKVRYKDADPADDVIISKGENECFIISEEKQEDLDSEMNERGFWMIVGGALLAVLALGFLLFRTGIIKSL